jgi:hypothetical protein
MVKPATIYQQRWRANHPGTDKVYRQTHYVLRISFSSSDGDQLKKVFGNELRDVAKKLLRAEMLKRELAASKS